MSVCSRSRLFYHYSQWRLSERDGVSNHRRLDCLLARLFRRISKNTAKLRCTGLCDWNPPVTGGFPSQRACNAEKCFHLMTSSCFSQQYDLCEPENMSWQQPFLSMWPYVHRDHTLVCQVANRVKLAFVRLILQDSNLRAARQPCKVWVF